jgi:hypothetical protein
MPSALGIDRRSVIVHGNGTPACSVDVWDRGAEVLPMNLETFKASLLERAPPAGIGHALEALWHVANGDWQAAHEIAQGHDDEGSAWVHAYLHRLEGDDENARYWYGKAGRPPCLEPRQQEWEQMVEALLPEAKG